MTAQSLAVRTVRSRDVLSIVLVGCLALGLGWWLYHELYSAPLVVELDEAEDAEYRVTRLLDVVKVVTQEVETTVTARRTDENWRGRVDVEIEAPVKLLYGVDLTAGEVSVDMRTPGYARITVPEPKLLYHDFDPSRIVEKKVKTTGMRTRWGAGQTQLTLCIYIDLPNEIRKVSTSRELLKEVRERSRAQLRQLFEAVLPEETWVEVRFASEAKPQPRRARPETKA